MSLFISSLNSGSNGNCYYIGNQHEAVLVDAGISCREIEKRMTRSGLSMRKVKAVFVSHEHSDHIRGIDTISKKYKLPVYITESTYNGSRLRFDRELMKPFRAYDPLHVGGLTITAFPKMHDAAEPHSFTVEGEGVKIGVFTDIGSSCEHVVHNFKQCHAAFLEANYDEKMLEEGSYPYYLKQRIRGEKGHLSNMQALELFTVHKPAFMSHLLLSHLSKDNNSPKIVHELFTQHAEETHIVVASRDKESEVYNIRPGILTDYEDQQKPLRSGKAQMSLF
jgi:phosphoribosyl 1,2-cyclic phosphodiesterase